MTIEIEPADLSNQLVQQVKEAIALKQPLRIIGNNSKRGLPHSGKSNHGVLQLAAHKGVVHYDPAELMLTVRAGTTIREINNQLAEQGQMLSSEPPEFDGKATIGGTLAANLSGAARPWAGSIRDHVLGVRLINGRGKHLQFGGQVMKNVAGFDVTRLQAGAMGTLGVMTEISIRTMPIPAASATVKISIAADDAIVAMNKLAATSAPLTAACWQQGRLSYRFSGAESSVQQAVATLQNTQPVELLAADAANELWQQISSKTENIVQQTQWRFSVKSTAALPTINAASNQWIIDWGGAQRWLDGEQSWSEMISLAKQMQGEVTKFNTDGSIENMPLSKPLESLRLRVKQAFDPNGIFNSNQWRYPAVSLSSEPNTDNSERL
jgi:glycolate oxidase FAD binding subunit